MGIHLVGALAVLFAPRVWPWALGGMAVDQLSLAAVGCWPRSRWLGPNTTRLPSMRAGIGADGSDGSPGSVALTFDDGPDPGVTPRVLDLLDNKGAKATFFCVGHRARQYPDVVRSIASAGHTVANHTDSHSYAFGFFGPRRIARELDQASETLAELAGERSPWFRPPAGIRSPLLDPLLFRRGLRLVSWTRRGYDAVSTDPDRIYNRLSRELAGGDILLLHDGTFASGEKALERPVLKVLPRLLQRLDELGLRSIAMVAEDC